MENKYADYTFLNDAGEMGELTRSYNWAATPLGPIEHWPVSLRTTVGIVLHSAFPMLVFWGEGLITIYNDPYIKTLENTGKHPVLGAHAWDIWPESWHMVEGLIKKVYNEGKSVAFSDQLIPIIRNGKTEDVYWTFSYSPAYGDRGEIAGVVITCIETTDKVQNIIELKTSKQELEFAIDATELGTWEVNPVKGTLKANARLKEWFGLSPDEEVLLSSATDVIVEEDRQRVINAIEYALQYESGGHYDIEYDIENPSTGLRRSVRAKGRTWFDDDHKAYRFNGTLHDITEQVKARRKIEQSEQRFRNLVSEAIVATAILTGPDMVLELVNDAMLHIWDRDRSILNKPLLEFMPELKDQPFPKLLEKVMATGQEYIAQDALVLLHKKGRLEQVYMDFSYKPLTDERGKINSILVMATDVTERVLANRRLAQSEQNLRNTILKAPVAMAIFKGSDMIIEIANERMLELWGKTANEVIGKPQFTGVPEAGNQGFEELFRYVYTTGNSYSAQASAVTLPRNGSIETVYVNFAFEAYKDPDGNIAGVIAVAIDVTEQVIANKKLLESEQQVRAIISSAPFPIGVYEGREMRIVFANQSIIDVWDKGQDVIGKTYFEILPELENQGIYPIIRRVYDTGEPYHARNQRVDLLVDSKLQTYYFNYSFTPLFDSAGKVYGVMNTAAEVTDLNIAKQKIEQSERNFRNMIVQAPVAMCIMLGPEHIVDIANDMMINLWGRPAEEVLGKPIFTGLPDASEQGLEQLLAKVYTTGETVMANERPVELVRNGKPEIVYINFVYEPYKDAGGDILGVLAISIDVTAQVLARHKIEEVVKERTAELEHANANLQRSNAELAQFAYIASHDLQEPVRKISIFAQMLASRIGIDSLDEQAQNYLDKISISAARMHALIRDILAYSELVKKPEIYTEVDLNEIIKGTIVDYELLIEQKQASVHYGTLPVIDAIPLQMSQLFGNLVSNSLKYARPGVKPEINIKAALLSGQESALYGEGSYFKIVFSDNGIGFSQEYAEKIFNIFQRLHGKTEFSGTGIGLAICKKIVQNHNGAIMAHSSEGSGAAFTIILPLKQQ